MWYIKKDMQNIPNILSLTRLLLTIPVFILVTINQTWSFAAATVIFFLGAVTDFLDGYFAKRLNSRSSLGVFLDLAADKIFVICALLAIVQIGLIYTWLVAIIITREFLVTSLRCEAASIGQVISAKKWGKQKTMITMISIIFLLLAKSLNSQIILLLGQTLFILAVIWTIFSGIEYVKISLPLILKQQNNKK